MLYPVYDAMVAYHKLANNAYYVGCKTSILNNPNNQILTPKGRSTLVRQVDAGGAGNYNKDLGWMTTYGGGKGVEWISYTAEYDRAKVMTVDAITEEQSYLAGTTPSIELLNNNFFNNYMGPELDAVTIAKLYSGIPLVNRHINTDARFKVDSDNILQTLNNIDKLVFDSGYDGEVVLFISSTAYSNLISAIQNKMGLANTALMERSATVYLDNGAGDLIKRADDSVKVDIKFETYGRFLLMRMPENRMYSNVIMYSGDPKDPVQKVGGVAPDFTNPNFAKIDMLAIPITAAFTNIRYIVDNFLYPASLQAQFSSKVDLSVLNKRMFGNVEINHAGINQKANAFEYDIRVIYGGALFDNRAHNCFAVTSTPAAGKKVTSITLTDQGGTNKVRKDQTISLEADVKPDDAFNREVDFSVEDGSGMAEINYNGVLTGIAAGTVTAKATAKDGSGVVGKLQITVEE